MVNHAPAAKTSRLFEAAPMFYFILRQVIGSFGDHGIRSSSENVLSFFRQIFLCRFYCIYEPAAAMGPAASRYQGLFLRESVIGLITIRYSSPSVICSSSVPKPKPTTTTASDSLHAWYVSTYRTDISIDVIGFVPLWVNIKGTNICFSTSVKRHLFPPKRRIRRNRPFTGFNRNPVPDLQW